MKHQLGFVLTLTLILLFGEFMNVTAITESDNDISLRDATHTKDRPRLEGYDMDEDVKG